MAFRRDIMPFPEGNYIFRAFVATPSNLFPSAHSVNLENHLINAETSIRSDSFIPAMTANVIFIHDFYPCLEDTYPFCVNELNNLSADSVNSLGVLGYAGTNTARLGNYVCLQDHPFPVFRTIISIPCSKIKYSFSFRGSRMPFRL